MLINSSTTHPVEKDRMQYQFLVKKKKKKHSASSTDKIFLKSQQKP